MLDLNDPLGYLRGDDTRCPCCGADAIDARDLRADGTRCVHCPDDDAPAGRPVEVVEIPPDADLEAWLDARVAEAIAHQDARAGDVAPDRAVARAAGP